jgi:hypothetical protein
MVCVTSRAMLWVRTKGALVRKTDRGWEENGIWQFKTFSLSVLLKRDFLVTFSIQFSESSFCFSSHPFYNIKNNDHPSAAQVIYCTHQCISIIALILANQRLTIARRNGPIEAPKRTPLDWGTQVLNHISSPGVKCNQGVIIHAIHCVGRHGRIGAHLCMHK